MSQCQICQVILCSEQVQQCWAYHLSDDIMRLYNFEAGAIVCWECYKALEEEKNTLLQRKRDMELCQRCHGHISYEIQEDDGFQFIASLCSCATERTMVNSHNVRYYEKLLGRVAAKPADFIEAEEMRI